MAVSAIRELRPMHVFEMMERLGIEPSSSIAPRLSASAELTQQRSTAAKFAHTMGTAVTGSITCLALIGSAPHFFVQTQTSYLNCTSIKSDPPLRRPPSPLRSVEIFQRTATFNRRVRLANIPTSAPNMCFRCKSRGTLGLF